MSVHPDTPPYDQRSIIFERPVDVALLSDQTLECLAYFQRWLTPRDKEAAQRCAELRHVAPDYGGLRALGPACEPALEALRRRFDAFEEAGRLIVSGSMRADLFFDAWYDVPHAWAEARPYVLGMRVDTAAPRLYENFEWLAQRAEEYREESRRSPPKWRPIAYPEPSTADKLVFDTFCTHSLPSSGDAGWALFTMLQRHGRTANSFDSLVPARSSAEVVFERFMYAYERAGALVKHGIIHPTLFFTTWRSPIEIWAAAEEGVAIMKQRHGLPRLWENVAWLAGFELEWHKRIAGLAQEVVAYRASAG